MGVIGAINWYIFHGLLMGWLSLSITGEGTGYLHYKLLRDFVVEQNRKSGRIICFMHTLFQ